MRFALAIILTAASVGPASAQEAPNLVGTWKGNAIVVHMGSNPYRVAEGKGPNFPDNEIEFTYTIAEQSGNRFAGEASGGKYSETIIGAISRDNHSIVMLDDDGQYLATLRDENTIDLCYNHTFPTTRVVGCWTIARSP